MPIRLIKSPRKEKKWRAIFPDGKHIDFGARGYQDFTQHHDESRKKNYLTRHQNDPKTIHSAGGLARDILWSKSIMKDAIKFAEKKHGVKISY
jgi:hypothetical protein